MVGAMKFGRRIAIVEDVDVDDFQRKNGGSGTGTIEKPSQRISRRQSRSSGRLALVFVVRVGEQNC